MEAGDKPEMPEIDGKNGEAKRERCGPDPQVSERNSHVLGPLLAVDLSGQHCALFRVGIDRKIAQQFFNEGLATKPHLWGLCAIDVVNEFC